MIVDVHQLEITHERGHCLLHDVCCTIITIIYVFFFGLRNGKYDRSRDAVARFVSRRPLLDGGHSLTGQVGVTEAKGMTIRDCRCT